MQVEFPAYTALTYLRANCPQILPYAQEIGSKTIAVGGHLQVENYTEIYFCRGWGSLQRSSGPLAGGEAARSPSPRTPPLMGLSGLGTPFALPGNNPAGARANKIIKSRIELYGYRIEHSDSRFESIHRFILSESIRIDSF